MTGRPSQLAEEVCFLVLDVDGVLTDGRLLYAERNPDDIKGFDIKDGLGIKLAQAAGIDVAIITGRQSDAVSRRADDLGIATVLQGREDKGTALTELAASSGLSLNQIAYMGDDLPDLPAIKMAGIGACPSDAIEIVRQAADWVSPFSGGQGAVRSLCDFLLDSQGKMSGILRKYQ